MIILQHSPINYKKLSIFLIILAQVFHKDLYADYGFFGYLAKKNYRFFYCILYKQLIYNSK